MRQLMERYKARLEDMIRQLTELEICEKHVNSMYHLLMCYDKIVDMFKDEDFE